DDLGVAEDLLVTTEELAGDRMGERLALAEDRVLLAEHGAVALVDVEEDFRPLHRDDHPLDGLEGPGEVVRHEAEGGARTVAHAGQHRLGQEQEEPHQRQESRPTALQKVTEGWCTPKTAPTPPHTSPT